MSLLVNLMQLSWIKVFISFKKNLTDGKFLYPKELFLSDLSLKTTFVDVTYKKVY